MAGACGREKDIGSKEGKTAAVKMLCCGLGLVMLVTVLMRLRAGNGGLHNGREENMRLTDWFRALLLIGQQEDCKSQVLEDRCFRACGRAPLQQREISLYISNPRAEATHRMQGLSI